MLAAAMQTCSAALNSTATLVAYDLFKRHQPGMSDHQLVRIGKITTIFGTILAIAASPMFGHYPTIFEGINKLISYVAPPITAVFLPRRLLEARRGNPPLHYAHHGHGPRFHGFFYLDWNNIYRGNFLLVAFFLFVACLFIMGTTTMVFPERLKDEARLLVWENWREPLRGRGKHGHGSRLQLSCASRS